MQEKVIFLCNRNQHVLSGSENIEHLYSDADFKRFRAANNSTPDAVVITAELRWNDMYYTDLGGLAFIKTIRVDNKWKCPIYVASFLPFSHFSENYTASSSANMHYFKDPSVTYLPMLDFQERGVALLKEKQVKPLDDELYQDLCLNLYEGCAFTKNLFTEIEDWLIDKKGFLVDKYIIDNFFGKIIRLLPDAAGKVSSIYHDFVRSFFESSSRQGADLLLEGIRTCKKHVLQAIPKDAFFSARELHEGNRPEVLYVRNQEKEGVAMEKAFAKLHMKCKVVKDGDAALEVLKQDRHNKINTVIVHFRYWDREHHFSTEQGYHIARKLADFANEFKLVVLTDHENLKQCLGTNMPNPGFKYPFVRHEVFASSKSLQQFCAHVAEMSKAVSKEIEKPNEFTERMQELYQQHRQSDDYISEEDMISKHAFYAVLELKIERKYDKTLLPKINRKITNKKEHTNLENFREILLARRIILGLCQLSEADLKKGSFDAQRSIDLSDRWYIIYYALKNGKLGIDRDNLPEQTELQTVINRNMRFSTTKSYKWGTASVSGLTVEEKKWLEAFSRKIAETTRLE